MYTKEEIIRLAQEVHGNKYDYSMTEGVLNKGEKITYRCKKHNYIHTQALHNHLQGKGCPICAKEKRRLGRLFTEDEFIRRASLNRDDLDKYDFEKSDLLFRDELGRMKIYCKEHGIFLIQPRHFINGVEGCKFCNGRNKNDEDVVNELKKIHPSLDFSETKYSERDKKDRIKVICPEHGVKYMNYRNLLYGAGCYECSMREFGLAIRLKDEEIIKRGKEIYGDDTYTYEHLDSINGRKDGKITVTCPKHGDFLVNLSNFVTGKSGCPECRHSKLELFMANNLKKNDINFVSQKTFDWLRYKSNLYLDFYLPEYNIGIECQGIQHFVNLDTKLLGDFETNQMRDATKKKLCEEHGVDLIYYMDDKFVKNKKDFSRIKDVIHYIKNNAQS